MAAPDEYLREIETRFVALRGRGFALSAKDVGRVLAWQAEGVPLRVVLQSMEEVMRRWRVDGSRRAPTLGGLERSIDAAMKRRSERLVPKREDSGPSTEQWKRLRAAIDAACGAQTDEGGRSILRRAWNTLLTEEVAGADVWSVAAKLDAEMADDFARCLLEEERAVMARAVETLANEAGTRMSDGARAELTAFERGRWLRARFSVPELIGTLLR